MSKSLHKEIVVHSFSIGDVEDPDLWAAEPLHQWEHSDQGQWVMKNATEQPSWHRDHDLSSWGHLYRIMAKFTEKKLVEFYLKFGDKSFKK